jgi:chaperonin GroEL
MHATKAAVEEGIVPGGGVALLRVIKDLEALDKEEKDEDRASGIRIVKRSLEEPLRQIAINAGHEGSVVVNQVKELKADTGFDAQAEIFVNMVEAGIVDPTKVVRSSLQNAVSIAGLMLTTEALVSEIPEKKKDPAYAGAGMNEDF